MTNTVSAAGVAGSAVHVTGQANAGNTAFYGTSVAHAGGSYLAAWSVWVNGGTPPNVYAVPSTDAGAFVSANVAGLCSGTGCDDPRVSAVGAGFYATWFALHIGAPGTQDQRYDVYGSAVTSSGAVLSPNGELVTQTTATTSETGPLLAMRTSTQGLLVYNVGTNGGPQATFRMRARLVSFDPAPDAGPDGAAPDASDDGAAGAPDSGEEAGLDAGPDADLDSGAPADAGSGAPADAGSGAPADAGSGATSDAGIDAAAADGGADADASLLADAAPVGVDAAPDASDAGDGDGDGGDGRDPDHGGCDACSFGRPERSAPWLPILFVGATWFARSLGRKRRSRAGAESARPSR